MPLRFANDPTNGSAMVRAGLDRLASRPEAHTPATFAGAGFGALQINPPHAIYDIRADEVVNGRGLSTAQATGVRYLVESAGTAVAAAEVHLDEAGEAKLLVNMNYGPFVAATQRALAALAVDATVSAGTYEARLLRFSAIPTLAIWLKADGGGADIIYPLPPVPDVLQAEKPYTVNDYLAALMPLARKRVASVDSPALP